ncbi:hypothetical protein BDV26DRAFT_287 [Aspergillus bertholletiae]|uniref:Zn(2)-C6 fungal-type domain-containing protein n=1 Tax=Aspergillus bertholletiae TaxID=1226010 RepID=A0A5N7BPK4_9EURO|nr:hypothetical protein BDV26DRAFT_287 [Aspergillus bertholletiae]
MSTIFPRPSARVAKACFSCRRRKVKCDMDSRHSKCRACQRRRSACLTAAFQAQPLEGGQFINPNSLFNSIDPKDLHADSIPPASNHNNLLDPLSTVGPPEYDSSYLDTIDISATIQLRLDQPTPQYDSLPTLPCFTLPRCLTGQLDPAGSPPFSIFSSEGKSWLRKIVNDSTIDTESLTHCHHPISRPDSELTTGAFKPCIPLPPIAVAQHLFETYFEMFNQFCPLLDEASFMLDVSNQYPVDCCFYPAEWACLNAILALGCLVDTKFQDRAWKYLKNAILVSEKFLTEPPNGVTVLTLLFISIYHAVTFNGHASRAVASLVIRVLHSFDASQYQIAPLNRVIIGMAQSIDIDNALQVGMPPTTPVLDIPPRTSYDSIVHPFAPEINESAPYDSFDSFCILLTLKYDMYRQLYSLTAWDKRDAEVISTVGDLDTRLENWKQTIPKRYRPNPIGAKQHTGKSPPWNILYLQLSYYNCLLVIHRRAIPCATWGIRLDPSQSNSSLRPSNARSLSSAHICATAARESMRLVKCIPRHNPLISGTMVYYALFALKLFAILIVEQPSLARPTADIRLMYSLEDHLSANPLPKDIQNTVGVIRYCVSYRNLAERAIRKAFPSVNVSRWDANGVRPPGESCG